ncbi:hypothetical protein [Methylorubrum thiocyanatum]|uniref:hypothetical protein n=1 Tax=Methylorubrum thiocyanatum TaxID=47958 RepID=UPI003F803B52
MRRDPVLCGSAETLFGAHAPVVAQVPVLRAFGKVLTKIIFCGCGAAFLVAVQQLNATTARAEPLDKQQRSNFQYQDGQAPEKRPYKKPKLDVDPTDLSLEEMRARLNYLEERIERIELVVERLERVKR